MIYILVPVFKKLEKTKIFLASLKAEINASYKVIITDDSPDHEHIDYFHNQDCDYIYVADGNGELYWGGGINHCIRFMQAKFTINRDDIIIFANNDIVLEKHAFVILHQQLVKTPNTILHPKLVDESGQALSAGSRVLLWVLFLTSHKLSKTEPLTRVDLASARFLMFTYDTLLQLKGINEKLPHYGGDNDFTLRAKKIGIYTYIASNALCRVDESETGDKVANIDNIGLLLRSFFSIKSPNSIEYRYKFISSHFNPVMSALVVFSMSIKSILLFIKKKSL